MSHGHSSRPVFKSGTSFGAGLTYQLDEIKAGVNAYMDTPGLADMTMRKQAAAAITQALKKDGFYKIFFVISESNGRVRAEDVTTIKLVLDAAPITTYGIIVNQISEKVFAKLQQPKNAEQFMVTLLGGLPKKTTYIHHIPFKDELDGADNAAHSLPQDVLHFIENTPGVMIPKVQAKAVKGDDFEAVNEQLEKMQRQMKQDREAFEREKANLKRDLSQQLEEQRRQQEQERANWQEQLNQQRRNREEWMHERMERMERQRSESDAFGSLGTLALGVLGTMAFLR